MQSVSITENIPVAGSYDVVVCGGGPAGFIAAISAAREGAKTAIIEQYGFFGGMATAGLVAPISVFSYNGERNIGGIPWEFIERLKAMGGAIVEEPLNNIAFDPELYKLCAQRMMEEARVDMYMHSYISNSIMDGNTIKSIVIRNKNGAEAIEGKVFIDATGDADVAAMAHAPMQKQDRPFQPMSTYFILSGVDTSSKVVSEAMHHNKQGVNCQSMPIREKLLELSEKEDLPLFGGPWFCTVLREGCVAVNITRAPGNVLDNRDYSRAERILREDAYRWAAVLRENIPEFRACKVEAVATQAGIRESRHIQGIHVITGEEYLHAYRYHDSISRCSHPIDIHTTDGAKQNVAFLKEAAYIPYRSLIIDRFPNLIVAGRSISADMTAFASIRVQASCMGMGQAAGVAAAESVEQATSVAGIDIQHLVSRLKEMGAVI